MKTQNLRKHKIEKKTLTKLPKVSGVYFFFDKKGDPIYIGKANNIKDRLSSYFAVKLEGKTKRMVNESVNLSFIKVTSELEALLLEARLIRKFKPKYNISLKDDKHPLYIQITKDEYPLVKTARKIDQKQKNLAFFGPFPSSTSVKSVLKMLRKVFPFADHKTGKRECLYSQIGLCNPCPSLIETEKSPKVKKEMKNKYKENIGYIILFLEGNFPKIKSSLEKEMKKLAKSQNFEKAAKFRDQISLLDYITQPVIPVEKFLKNPNLLEDVRKKEMKELKNILASHSKTNLNRIECYDISHLSGIHTTASMVTFIEGENDKSLYRHFKIKQKTKGDDIASLTEVAQRRARLLVSWGKPDLIIVDGGKAQTNAFKKVFDEHKITVVGIAKREETLIIPNNAGGFYEIVLPKGPARNLVQRLRNEAHRFARRYHHHLLRKSLVAK